MAPPAWFDLAAEAGYQRVGIRVLPAGPGSVAYPLSKSVVADWRRRLADAGLGVHDVEFIPLTPEVRVADQADTLALAAELGARRLNVSGDDPDLDRLVENFAAICDLAGAAGLGVDLEFMRFRVIGTLQQAVEVVTRAGRPNGRLLVDLLHLHRAGGSAEMLAAVPDGLLGSVQLCDGPRVSPPLAELANEARENRLFPGEGELPLLAMLDALPRNIPVGVEVPTARSHPTLTPLARATRAATTARALLAQWRPQR